MPFSFKPYQIIISIAIIFICAIVSVTYAHSAFSTLTDRPGFYGSLYIYYRVGKIGFGIYNLFIALVSCLIFILQIKGLIQKDKLVFKRSCWMFLGLAILLIVAEIYLQLNFRGKG